MRDEDVKIEKKSDLLDSILNLFFSKDRTKILVLLVVFLGLILRVIAAINLDTSADDVNTAILATGISESGKLTIWSQSNALYHYLMDFSYNIFGVTQFASRFPAIVFGTMSIILIFLLTKRFFKSNKIGLIAAFLLAVSPWHIRNTLAEMDVTAMFFVLLSGLFLIKAIDSSEKERKYMVLAGIAIGLGILVKLYVLFFAFSFFVFFLYTRRKRLNLSWKNLAIFTLIGFILISPSITSNYLLYKDKGYVDFIPTNVFGIGVEKGAELYSWDAGWGKNPDYIGFFTNTAHYDVNLPGGLLTLRFLLYADPVVFLLGFLGLFMIFKRQKNYFIFFILSFIPIWFYISSVTPLSKHLLFESVLFIPPAAFCLSNFHDRLFKRVLKLRYLLIFILIINVVLLGVLNGVSSAHFYNKSSIAQFITFKNKYISEDAFILYDGRIYRGRANWMMQERFFLEASLIDSLTESLQQQSDSDPVSIKTYFVECARDDCGWGTIKDQPEFNQSMEAFVQLFSGISEPEIITQKTGRFVYPLLGESEEVFKIYSADLLLKPEILSASEYTHNWFLYPNNYNDEYGEIFDVYETQGVFPSMLDKLAHAIFYIALLLAIISAIFPIYLFFKER